MRITCFVWRPTLIYDNIFAHFFLRRRNVSDKSCRESQNTHFSFINGFRKLCCVTLHLVGYILEITESSLRIVDRNRVADITTRYGLDGPGSSPGVQDIFWVLPDCFWGPPSHLEKGYWISFLGLRLPGRGFDHAPPSSAKAKERVKLYFYSSSGNS